MDGTPVNSSDANILEVSDVTAGYNKRRVVTGVSLHVKPGEVVGVLGHNGAGKTTMLKCIFRMQPVDSGDITFDGKSITKSSSVKTVSNGMSFTPSERPIFRDLTVQQNLELGAHSVRDRGQIKERIEGVIELFPMLGERRSELAGRFSGGQQRQLSIAMALMVQPKLMLLDEPSLGISPAVVEKTFATIRELAAERGMSVLIVEQNVKAMTAVADRVYVLRHGEIVLEESGDAARERTEWWHLF